MDGVENGQLEGVVVLGATNHPWQLDTAIRRRFEKRIYIDFPSFDARLDMIQQKIAKTLNHLTADEMKLLACKTKRFSGSDIDTLTKAAAHEPLARLFSASHFIRCDGHCVPSQAGSYYVPCSPEYPQALCMRAHDI
jgi:vacuolar protein-sorting-associated protein 4